MATIIRTSRAKLPKRSAGGAKSQVTSIRRFVPPARPHKPFPVVARGLPHKNGLNDQHSEVKQRVRIDCSSTNAAPPKAKIARAATTLVSHQLKITLHMPLSPAVSGRTCKSDTTADFVHRDHRGAYCRTSSSTAKFW